MFIELYKVIEFIRDNYGYVIVVIISAILWWSIRPWKPVEKQ